MHESYIKENGNIIINYKRVKVSNRILLFIIPEFLLLYFCYWLFKDNVKYILEAFTILGIVLFAFIWFLFVDRINKKIEQRLSYRYLNDVIKKQVGQIASNVNEIERKYFRTDNKNETDRGVIVLLSNGMKLKYNIIDIAEYDKYCVLEIDIHYSILGEEN